MSYRDESSEGGIQEPGTRVDLASLTRRNLARCVESRLHRGGWGNPDVLLVRVGDRTVVVKDYAPRRAWVRATLGRFITAREQRVYRRLAGLESVPRLLGKLDELAFILEYRPGRSLTRSLAGSLPAGFVAELERSVAAMHERGVVHLDLRHRSNVLAGEDGHPVLIDFASAICFRPGSLAGRWIRPALVRLDQRALHKWRERLGPGLTLR